MMTVFDMVWQYLLFKTPKVVIVIITLLENINGISNHINDNESNDDDAMVVVADKCPLTKYSNSFEKSYF